MDSNAKRKNFVVDSKKKLRDRVNLITLETNILVRYSWSSIC